MLRLSPPQAQMVLPPLNLEHAAQLKSPIQ